MFDFMKNIFYIFRGLIILINTVSKVLLKTLLPLLFPLILFLRIKSNSASNEEFFENIFVDSFQFYLIFSADLVLSECAVKLRRLRRRYQARTAKQS